MMFKKIAILSMLAFVACVPAKKFEEAQRSAKMHEEQHGECKVELNLLKKRIYQLEDEMSKQAKLINELEQDTTLVGMKNRTLQNRLAILENDLRLLASKLGDSPEYRALMKHLLQMQDELVDSEGKRVDTERAIAAQRRILAETSDALEMSNAELANKESMLQQSHQELEHKAEELSQARRNIEAQAARLREMEAELRAKDSAMYALRNKMAAALNNFSSDDLTVYNKDGKVYVSLEEKLLFQSGKYDVNANGVAALKQIAAILAANSDVNIVVEGHTDNVPFKGQVLVDNWDLSVKRATSVLRILLQNGNIATERIQATGRGDSSPLDSDNTAEARRKNRRTEIILAPSIDRIMGILEGE